MGITKYNNIDKVIFSIFAILLITTIISSLIMYNVRVSADSDTTSATASVNVNAACTMSASGTTHSATLTPGTFTGEIGTSNVNATCNDPAGYAIYAIGYSNNTYGNTNLINNADTNNPITILTGTATSGNTSSWSMKLASGAASTASPSQAVTIVTIPTNYTTYAPIPNTYTKVATYPTSTTISTNTNTTNTANTANTTDTTSTTAGQAGTSLTTTYGVYVSPTQTPGTYTGAVRYTLVHPHMNDDSNAPNLNLYDTVARMSKGKQNADDLRKEIVTPTAETPISTNSGVYEYNADEFGIASDASNDYNIYYYRGVLDTYTGLGTYGSDGMADAYPNYVRLGNNTCWRIVRTTGSGGVKMIYNGTWDGDTCGNTVNAVLAGSSIFGPDNWNHKTIVGGGYTYNATYASTSATTASPINVVLSNNGSNSLIKTYVEDEWYANNMINYTEILESGAGHCNDRSVYSINGVLQEETTEIIPYGTSDMVGYYFGARIRNAGAGGQATLACPRGQVDIYATVTNETGNGLLYYPVSLLTADESSFAGSGKGANYASTYSPNSYLRSGSRFWFLSPSTRTSDGSLQKMGLYENGSISSDGVSGSYGVRPVISLVHNTTITSGSGTATDPWMIDE